jgi:hypothetical protein
MTPERMEKLIAKADAGKLDRALERLKETTAPRSGGSNPR